jgi:PleD family two-component response regulator
MTVVRRSSGGVEAPSLPASSKKEMSDPQSQPPLVLIASAGEWVGRSLENVLESNGYTVLRLESGRRALELARRVRPNALLIDDSLSDIAGIDVCRALRDDPLFDHATPVILMSAVQQASRARVAAYEAGVWDYCSLPLDVETLLAKLATFIRAGREIESGRSKALVDRSTGLYSSYGLQQMVEQLGAHAVRKSEPMACVVLSPSMDLPEGGSPTTEQSLEALTEMTDLCRSSSRRSDVIGYLGDSRVAILAPDTDLAGIQRLIDRLQAALARLVTKTRTGRRSQALRAGYCAVSDLAAAKLDAGEIVRRAETALDHAPRGRFDVAAVNFDEVLTS